MKISDKKGNSISWPRIFLRFYKVNSPTFYAIPTGCQTFIFIDLCHAIPFSANGGHTRSKILKFLRPAKYYSSA